jgi:hypothetical protein
MKKIEHKHHVFYENEIQEGKALDILRYPEFATQDSSMLLSINSIFL